MAANDELPRGWTQQVQSNGGTASVTYPAIAGIAWKLTAIQAQLESATAANYVTGIVTSLGANGPQGLIVLGILAGGTVAISEYDWSGGALGPVGAALTIAFTAGSANLIEQLTTTAVPV
jgi:hypothetical protein